MIDICSCLGARDGEPHCMCMMISKGLKTKYDYSTTPEYKERLKFALSEIFKWKEPKEQIMKYKKIKSSGNIFYIQETLFLSKYDGDKRKFSSYPYSAQLFDSDVVIGEFGVIIKCIIDLENILDKNINS